MHRNYEDRMIERNGRHYTVTNVETTLVLLIRMLLHPVQTDVVVIEFRINEVIVYSSNVRVIIIFTLPTIVYKPINHVTSEQTQETRDVHAPGPLRSPNIQRTWPVRVSYGWDDETRTKTVDGARAVESAGQEGESQDILCLSVCCGVV